MIELTSFPAFRRFTTIKRQNSRSHQNMIQVLQILRLPPKFLTSLERHQISLPDQNLGHRFARFAQLLLNLLLHTTTIPHINEHKRLNISLRKNLGCSRSKRPIRTGDERSTSFVRPCSHGRSSVALLVQTLPGEVLFQKEGYTVGEDENDECRNDRDNAQIGHFDDCAGRSSFVAWCRNELINGLRERTVCGVKERSGTRFRLYSPTLARLRHLGLVDGEVS